ncbi:MAG: family 20 glycosylhydrolase [Spirochaetaceae bacterium]
MRSSSLSDLAARIVPAPRTVRDAAGVLSPEAAPSLADLRDYRLGEPLPPPVMEAPDDVSGIPGGSGARSARGSRSGIPESFTMRIQPDAVVIDAADDRGRLYALGTLRQLFVVSAGKALPCGRIEDRPALKDRGYMLDISRNRVPTVEYLTELLDLLMLLRFNHLELYVEHTFAYAGHRAVWDGWSPLTPQEVGCLDREAAARGIELVPNQNSFGHMTRWLEHDSYRALAEAPEGFIDPWGQRRDYPFSLSPAAPGVEEFLADLYDQLLPHFTSRRFNVGLDETFDLGQGLSASWVDAEAQRLTADPGTESRAAAADLRAAGAGGTTAPRAADLRGVAKGRVYLSFLKRIHRLVTDRQRQMLFWADIVQNHPELVGEVPGDAVAIEWGYEADHDFDTRCRRLSEAGLPFLVAPGTAAWNSTGGRFETARANIVAAVGAAQKHGAAGILLTDWGDNGHIPPPVVSYPAIALAAALSWQGVGHPAGPGAPGDSGASRGVAQGAGGSGPIPDVFAWLDSFVLRDEAGRLAEGLRLLNTIDTHDARRIPNASILGVALLTFDKAVYAGLPEGTSPDTIRAVEDQAHRARSVLAAARPVDQQGELQKQELLFCADLTLFAVELLRQYAQASPDRGESPEDRWSLRKRLLRERLEGLRSQLAALWVGHSRKGGLERSLSMLERGLRNIESLRSGVGEE